MRGALPYPVPARGRSRCRALFPRRHDTGAAIAKLGVSIDRHGYDDKAPRLESTLPASEYRFLRACWAGHAALPSAAPGLYSRL